MMTFHRLFHRRWLRFFLLALLTVGLCCMGSPAIARLPELTILAQNPDAVAQQLQQGREAYQAGQYAEAVESWRQAAQAYQQQGDSVNQAMALSNLGLAYLQVGEDEQAESAIATSLSLLQSGPDTNYGQRVLAQSLSAQAQLQMAQGKAEPALETLDRAIDAYQALGDEAGVIRSQLNQAQILRVRGLYRESLARLNRVNETLQQQPDSTLKAAGLRQLGNALRLVGNLKQAREVLQQSLMVAQTVNSPTEISAALLNLGNAAAQQQSAAGQPEFTEALDFYQRAADQAVSPMTRLQALVNQLGLWVDLQDWEAARSRLPLIQTQLTDLPPSRTGIYIHINLARSLMQAEGRLLPNADIAQIVASALEQAQALEDVQAESYALGYLGQLYERSQQGTEALNLTRKALVLAQSVNADSITYQWQWQLGRLLTAQGQNEAAIAAYSETLKTLQALRSDLAAVNPDVSFSFREGVEPIYRELVSLLLQPGTAAASKQENLIQARNVIESLQVAELVNFFRADCVITQSTQIDQVDTQAAVIYPIILPDRVEVVLSIPGRPLTHYTAVVPQSTVEQTLDGLQQALAYPRVLEIDFADRARSARARSTRSQGGLIVDFLPLAQEVYDWLIRPIEAELAAAQTQTLVFVLDGALRNVPMAVLHDGQRYLVEKYAIALTPGLQLLDPHPLAERGVRVIVGGLTEARQNFAALPYVEQEVQVIQEEVPSEVLLNETFDKVTFEKTVEVLPFPVVHLATHGQFSSDPEDTFILTWDSRINASELSTLLQTSEISRDEAIELLILSACETAAGDDRAALGLAGVAVRSGARSTLATLWLVDDQGTSVLMRELYQKLGDTTLTKAEILRQAQLSLLHNPQYADPYFWAPFVLVGNWL